MGRTNFRELDDLVLELKGLLLVRSLRRKGGAASEELEMFSERIERTRDRLARLAQDDSLLHAA